MMVTAVIIASIRCLFCCHRLSSKLIMSSSNFSFTMIDSWELSMSINIQRCLTSSFSSMKKTNLFMLIFSYHFFFSLELSNILLNSDEVNRHLAFIFHPLQWIVCARMPGELQLVISKLFAEKIKSVFEMKNVPRERMSFSLFLSLSLCRYKKNLCRIC